MRFYFYRHAIRRNDFQFGVMFGRWQARISRSQLALWRDYESVFNFVSFPKAEATE